MSVDAGLLAFRVIVGLVLAAHGAQKLFGWFGGSGFSQTAGYMEKQGFRPGWFWATLATASEFGGGLALALGFLNPLPAVGIVAAMGIAVFHVHWKNGFFAMKGGVEYALVLMLTAGILGLVGPGRYSLDSALGLHLPTAPIFIGGVALAAIVIVAGLSFGSRKTAAAA